MDTVRFGRVLGHGARQAAKTLVSAVDAATAANPNPPSRPAPVQSTSPPQPVAPFTPAQTVSPSPSRRLVGTVLPPSTPRPQLIPTTRGLAEGSRRFGRAVWAPAVRLSGVLWLELTGVFFGLFALIAAIAAWRLHTALLAIPVSEARTRFFVAAGMIVVFGYFSVSSFLRANRRSRKP